MLHYRWRCLWHRWSCHVILWNDVTHGEIRPDKLHWRKTKLLHCHLRRLRLLLITVSARIPGGQRRTRSRRIVGWCLSGPSPRIQALREKRDWEGPKRCRNLLEVTDEDRSLQEQSDRPDAANDTSLRCFVSPASRAQATTEHGAHAMQPLAAGDINWQPPSPTPWEPLHLFLSLCFILMASNASVRVWLSRTAITQHHHRFYNTWINDDTGWEALLSAAGLEKGRTLKAHSHEAIWKTCPTRRYQSCSCNPLILGQESHLAKK